jgi:hypothetical protein
MTPRDRMYFTGVGFPYETSSECVNVLSDPFPVTIHFYAYNAPYSHNFIADLLDYDTV